MFITSKFNLKGIGQELTMFLVAALSLMTFSIASQWAILVSIMMAGVLLVIVLCFWAYRLKTITIDGNEVEVKHTCLPFLAHHYRFADFDYYIIDEKGSHETLWLLQQGKQVVKLSSTTYRNYDELKEALSVARFKEWRTDAGRAVNSVFAKSQLTSIFILLLLVLLAVAIPVAEHLEEGQVTSKSILLAMICGLVFLPVFMYALSQSKRLTIWQGRLEARSMLCPWKTDYFALDNLDYALEVLTRTQFENEESLWLVQGSKLAISIPKSVYANYDVLKHAIDIVPADTVSMNYLKKLRYHLGKTIEKNKLL